MGALFIPGARERAIQAEVRDELRQTVDLEVPDPYYGAAGGFDEVLDIVHAACAGLLEHIRELEGTGGDGTAPGARASGA